MARFEIVEVDRDYRAWSGSEVLEFDTLEQAKEYCRKESWTGYDYFVRREVN